jgi:hypothetical protein
MGGEQFLFHAMRNIISAYYCFIEFSKSRRNQQGQKQSGSKLRAVQTLRAISWQQHFPER